MSIGMSESALEQAALDWFRELGYEYVHGAHIALGANGRPPSTMWSYSVRLGKTS